jgi:hypothetical protein
MIFIGIHIIIVRLFNRITMLDNVMVGNDYHHMALSFAGRGYVFQTGEIVLNDTA